MQQLFTAAIIQSIDSEEKRCKFAIAMMVLIWLFNLLKTIRL